MGNLGTEQLLIIICGVVILSYIFSIVSRFIKIPSVFLLLLTGIAFKSISNRYGVNIVFPARLVEALGVVGLIMIVLEAGLDLKLKRDKLKMIRNSFFAALFILVISMAAITAIIHYWLYEPVLKCLIYAIPLSIMSSSIVLPSIHILTERKRDFLVFEASFSDILGILFFNYFAAGEVISAGGLAAFGGNLLLSVVLSVVISFVLFVIMSKTTLNIKFFLIFALLILVYESGKMLHLPSLIIILVFGLLINNWEQLKWQWLQKFFPLHEVQALTRLLHLVTAESSFVIRTFFFILFGYSIQLNFLYDQTIWEVGGLIVIVLFVVRFLYLRFFLHTNVFPETFFIPRGLITIVLFYKIPEANKLSGFDDDILFFIILVSSIVMTIGMMLYRKSSEDLVEEGQFLERKEIL